MTAAARSDQSSVPDRGWFDRDPLDVAPDLLGAFVTTRTDAGAVTLRITEVEAYRGGQDPASHAFRGRTARNAAMFGAAGRLYVYRHLGLHFCMNIVCGSGGEGGSADLGGAGDDAAAVLLRAGEVTAGVPLARERRIRAGVLRSDVELARGPARLTVALGIDLTAYGADVTDPRGGVVVHRPPPGSAGTVATGPRVGVSGPGGDGSAYPWRFWLAGEPTVSAFRPAYRRPARS